jgi:hypothetical protein
MDARFITKYVKDTYKNKTLDSIGSMSKTYSESVDELCKGETISYYVTELTNITTSPRSRGEADLVVGYIAKENTTFTFNFGPIRQSREITAGAFEFAYCGQVLPVVSALFSDYLISDVSGSAYVIYAMLDTSMRNAALTTRDIIHLGDGLHNIANCQVYNKAEHDAAFERQQREQMENSFCNRVRRFFGGGVSHDNYTHVAIKAE